MADRGWNGPDENVVTMFSLQLENDNLKRQLKDQDKVRMDAWKEGDISGCLQTLGICAIIFANIGFRGKITGDYNWWFWLFFGIGYALLPYVRKIKRDLLVAACRDWWQLIRTSSWYRWFMLIVIVGVGFSYWLGSCT